MVASIDNLKSTVASRGGIARPNNFLVELPSLPGFSRASDPLNILCTNASIPSKQILTTDRRIGMEFEKIAYGYAVDDVSLTFLLTNDYYVKRYFDRWKDFIINEDGTVKFDNYGKGLIFMPSALGYYSSVSLSIPAYSPLIFSVNLHRVNQSDHDRDGILSINEDINGDGNPLNDDTDGDGLPNMNDFDDDGDGVPTFNELDRNMDLSLIHI